MKKRKLASVFIIAFFFLSACSGPDAHIWLKSSGWSRAAYLGNTTLNDPVSLDLDTEGRIYFVLAEPNREDLQTKIFKLIALDPNGMPLWEHSLEKIPLLRPDSPQMIVDAENLQLFWLDQNKLYTLTLDMQGQPLQTAPILLSENISVDSYSLAKNASGETAVWFAGTRKNPGVYALSSFDGQGRILPIDPQGIRVRLRYDQNNTLHAAWLRYPVGYGATQLLYAAYPPQKTYESVPPQSIYELSVGPSGGLDGPVMGIDANEVYFFWTLIIRSGLEAGAIRTFYVHFPLEEPALVSAPEQLTMPSIYALRFEYLSDSPLDAGERVSLQSENLPRTEKIQEIVTNPMQTGELAMIFRSPTEHLWRKEREQVNVAYFHKGMPASYQPLSFTTTLSTSPNLLNSADRYLYAVWLEKMETDNYAVYFASTSPSIENALSRSSARELGRIFAQVSFGILVGILLAPIAAGIWVVAPLLVLFLFSPLRKIGSKRTQDIFAGVSLFFAIIAFWLGKIALLPGMTDYIPFSAWVPEIPHFLAEILRWGVPLISMLIALFVAWFYTYRKSNKSTLYFLLIYVGVDSFLTAAIYAVLIYGTI
jgi:hypothetical protein